MAESWEARHSSSQQMLQPSRGEGTLNLNQRTPSFFQSPSLVCMGGLNVLDPYEMPMVAEEKRESTPRNNSNLQISDHVDVTSGWGGELIDT